MGTVIESSTMKILFVITGLGLGGAEKVVQTLAENFVLQGHDVKIAYLKGSVALHFQQPIPLIALNFNGLPHIFYATKRLKALIKDFKPDVVHAHLFHACMLARCVRRLLPEFALVCTAHSKDIGGKFRETMYRLTDRWTDLNTNVSHEATAHFVQKKAFRQAVTVTNGVDTEKFKFNAEKRQQFRQVFHFSQDDCVFLAVGRLTPAKDYPNLLDAFAQLPLSAKLLIVGDGELKQILQNQIIEKNLDASVQFLGKRHDVNELLSMADIFVLSSAWEGFGLVVAEAMSCERVVIATDCGGVKEVLNDAKWLVQPKNTAQLASKMFEATQLSMTQQHMLGQQHRQRVIQQYAVSIMLENWLAIYKKIGKHHESL